MLLMSGLRDVLNGGLRRMPAWPVYAGSAGYAAWLFWLGLTGGLGVEPVEALEHALGKSALYMLVAGLAVTPLRRLAGLNLVKFRRAIGLSCFLFVCLHLLVWAFLDVQFIGEIWADILKRPYITVGMAAFVLMVPLAVTSNQMAVRQLGRRWRRLHRLTYAAAVLGVLHYVMLSKGWQPEPMVFALGVTGLLALRVRARNGAPRGAVRGR